VNFVLPTLQVAISSTVPLTFCSAPQRRETSCVIPRYGSRWRADSALPLVLLLQLDRSETRPNGLKSALPD